MSAAKAASSPAMRGDGHRGSRFALPDLLQDPAVAVGVAEVGERAVVGVLGVRARRPAVRRHVPDLAHLDAAADELGARRLDVGDDEVRAAVGARRRVGDPDPDRERARRAGRGDLDDAELLVRLVVDVEVEAALLDVELLGAVDVRDGDQHELELEIHDAASWVLVGRSETCNAGPARKLIGAAMRRRGELAQNWRTTTWNRTPRVENTWLPNDNCSLPR